MHDDLRSFLQALDHAGELARVRAAVSPVLEIAEIADRMSKSPAPHLPSASARRNDPRFHHLGGQALLFENVQGSDIPVLINAYGSYRRMETALGCNDAGPGLNPGHTPGGFDAIARVIGDLVKPQPPSSLREAIAKARQFLPLLRVPPKRRRGLGQCQQVIRTGDDVDLTRLPILRCWPLDGDFAAVGYPAGVNDSVPGLSRGPDWDARFRGRYITLAGIHTIHADDVGNPKPPSHNIGMYRVQLFGPRTMSMHWHMHHDGARHWRSWKARGERMPVAVVLGGEAVLPYAATAPLPPGISELLMAGFLNRGGIEMVMGRTVPIWIPANAEIVIEGYVRDDAGFIGWDPRDAPHAATGYSTEPLGPGAVFEGPFGDHTGFYSMPDRYPLLEVTAITHRRDPIYPTTVVGLPPQEDYFLGKATERIFLPLLKTLIPDIEDYDLPMFGAFHNAAFLKIDKHYPLQGRRVMHSVWGAGQMAWTKAIAVVDDDVDVHDTAAVLRAVGERCVPARDTELVRGPLDILDHAAPFLGAGTKIGLDATRKTSGAELHRNLSPLAAELCAAGEIAPVLGDDARASESRVRSIPGVRDARVPETLGGWWLMVSIDKRQPGDGRAFIKSLGSIADEVRLPRWTIVVGPDADARDTDDVLFHWTANSSPDRDRVLSVCGRRVAFDATSKAPGDEADGLPVRPWPPILRMSDEIRDRVSARWHEYGFRPLNEPNAPSAPNTSTMK
jgi:4-hydroxy-3-polyprenylbenzoate decarboxylase